VVEDVTTVGTGAEADVRMTMTFQAPTRTPIERD
jgi:hypothetical protein